jgi:hypothetical protein
MRWLELVSSSALVVGVLLASMKPARATEEYVNYSALTNDGTAGLINLSESPYLVLLVSFVILGVLAAVHVYSQKKNSNQMSGDPS